MRLGPSKPVDRRSFLRYSLVGSVGAGLSGFGVATLGFLWPRLGEGFGTEMMVGPVTEIVETVREERAPLHFPPGRLYLVRWDPSLAASRRLYEDHHLMLSDTEGVMALFQACPHLGCQVPWCQTSQWFECPCHGSRYNRIGEWMGGPAPRGMDRFPTRLDDDGNLLVDTGHLLTGPGRATRSLAQQQEGPSCVDA